MALIQLSKLLFYYLNLSLKILFINSQARRMIYVQSE